MAAEASFADLPIAPAPWRLWFLSHAAKELAAGAAKPLRPPKPPTEIFTSRWE